MKESYKECITISTKILSSKLLSTFIIIKNKFKQYQISLSEVFLKDHVILKTGVIATEITFYHANDIYNILK